MASMQELIQRVEGYKAAADECKTRMNAMIWSVLKAFSQHKFGWEGYDYSTDSPTWALLHNHLWAQYFDTFSIDGDEIVAGGMYQGSHSYYEFEQVQFPLEWLTLGDEPLHAAFDAAWNAVLDARRRGEEDAMTIRVEQERREYARLAEKYGPL